MLLQQVQEVKADTSPKPAEERNKGMQDAAVMSSALKKETIVMNYTTEDLCPISAISSSSMDSISSQHNMLVNA